MKDETVKKEVMKKIAKAKTIKRKIHLLQDLPISHDLQHAEDYIFMYIRDLKKSITHKY